MAYNLNCFYILIGIVIVKEMYQVIEFQESDGGGLAIVNSNWVTPRKKEVFWPPLKDSLAFSRVLKRGDKFDEKTWKLYSIKRIFYETDDFEKAASKLKQAEEFSDIATDNENCFNVGERPKRLRRTRRFSSSSEENDSCESAPLLAKNKGIKRPPPVKLPVIKQSQQESGPYEPSCSTSTSSTSSTNSNFVLGSVSDTPDLDKCNNNIFNTPQRAENSAKSSRGSFSTDSGNTTHSTTLRPTPRSVCDDEFHRKIYQVLVTVKLQNEQILNRLDAKDSTSVQSLPPTLPTEIPLKTQDDLTTLETYLKDKNNLNSLSCYLASLGGTGTSARISRILKTLMTDELASRYNFMGSRQNKLAFGTLALCRCIIRSVKLVEPDSSDRGCEDFIKNWLKHAPQRTKIKRRRTE